MNCKQAQRNIALWAGNDLDDPAQKAAVRQHVSGCACCRARYQQMKHTLQLLERAERPATYLPGDSLWPALAAQISRSRHTPALRWRAERFNGWAPAVAVTAACLVLLLVLFERPQSPLDQFPPTATAPVLSTDGPVVDSYRSASDRSHREDADRTRDRYDELRRLSEMRMRRLMDGF